MKQENLQIDADNYRKMSEPFENPDAANASLQKFMEGVRELRNACRISDVLVICSVNVLYETGGEGRAIVHGFNGDSQNSESMAAYAYGQESAERRKQINL